MILSCSRIAQNDDTHVFVLYAEVSQQGVFQDCVILAIARTFVQTFNGAGPVFACLPQPVVLAISKEPIDHVVHLRDLQAAALGFHLIQDGGIGAKTVTAAGSSFLIGVQLPRARCQRLLTGLSATDFPRDPNRRVGFKAVRLRGFWTVTAEVFTADAETCGLARGPIRTFCNSTGFAVGVVEIGEKCNAAGFADARAVSSRDA